MGEGNLTCHNTRVEVCGQFCEVDFVIPETELAYQVPGKHLPYRDIPPRKF